MAKKRKQYDWDAIEKDYRLGQKSYRTLSAEYGPPPGTISKRVKKYGWVQDKSQEVRERTKAALLAQETPKGNTLGNTPTRDDIEVAVQTNKQVILSHRKGIAKSQAIISLLLSQLKDAADNREELEAKVDEECTKPDGKIDYAKRKRLMRAISLPSHAAVLRDLSTAQKSLIALERQAFNLDDDKGGEAKDIAGLLNEIAGVTRDIHNNDKRKIRK